MSKPLSLFVAFAAGLACLTVAGAQTSVWRGVSNSGRDLPGTYVLMTIDGHPIPYAPMHPGTPAGAPPGPEVLAATLVVRPDGSFIMAMGYRRTVSGVERFQATPFSGTTAPDGAGFIARWEGAGANKLAFAGDTLVMDNEGVRFAYRRIR
ncbi:MAG TPA: hypothetical protein VLN49_04820 [Gemmatimonadaceae bacterium]|nr:hypothetical protein [Gemmatimonadaceae bacterium]